MAERQTFDQWWLNLPSFPLKLNDDMRRICEFSWEASERSAAQRKAALLEAVRSKQAEWMKHFHEISSAHYGDHIAEGIANQYRCCAHELDAVLAAIEEAFK